MRIAFCCQHNYWGGLNNCGGSRTIVLSCQALKRLGHKAYVVTHSDKLTWIKHDKPLKRISKDTDICVACSVSDIKPMLKHTPKKAKKFYWARLVENRQMQKEKLLKVASKVHIIVNSENLHDWFLAHGIGTEIVYQGIDLKNWQDKGKHDSKTIGFLISNKKRKHFDFIKKIVRRLGSEYKYVGYGVDLNKEIKAFVGKHFTYFKKNARHSDLMHIYNRAGIWVTTSTKEGLHNCPMEAALCGCAVVYPDAPLAGCSDHCIDGETAWKYNVLNVDSAVETIKAADKSRNVVHKELIRNKIGSRKQCMRKLVEKLKHN